MIDKEGIFMTIKELEKRRKEKGYSYKFLSDLTGVSENMLQMILNQEMDSLDYRIVYALESALADESLPQCVREEACDYMKRQGEYTIQDYYTLPRECRTELIDGVIYDMSAPGGSHQIAVMGVSNQIYNYTKKNQGKCRVFTAPLDVQLECDDKTMVEPDIIVLCDMKKFTERCIYGAPDFLIEILSESTRIRDTGIKLQKYRAAGVREYWIIDLKKERVIVYFFEEKEEPAIYGFDSRVPVGIYGGGLEIDFQEIQRELSMTE